MSRVKDAERILQMYVGDNNMVQFVDEVRYWFIIWSMITLTLWYNVSLQCSYCDCQDLASNKHLRENHMIIKRHMLPICELLPFIDHVAKFKWMTPQ